MLTCSIDNGLNLHAEAFANGIIHLQAEGLDGLQESLLNRYGFLNRLAPDTAAKVENGTLTTSGGVSLTLRSDGTFQLRKGETILTESLPGSCAASAPTVFRNRGFRLEMKLHDGEKLIGFGDQVRTHLLLNGQHDQLYLKYPVKHVPVPFYMSSRGYGIFFNTTRRLVFDVGHTTPGVARFAVEKEFLDLYLFTGNHYDEMIDLYTQLTGRPGLPPMKSFGLWFLFHTRATGHDILLYADAMRQKKIPCDNLSLEPNWMQTYYDCTADKEWNAEKFRGCENGSSYRGGPASMIKALNRMGYELGLWLCTRWDFTFEEERRIPGTDSGKQKEEKLILDGIELTHDDANVGHSPIYMDTNTIREQPWFEHLKKFVDDGARFFKLDPAWLINEFPDRLYGNGKTDDEMHNIAFLLASKQMNLGYEAFTGRRYYGISVAGWAGLQRYPGTWAGDTGGGIQSMTGLLQDAIVGHAYTTCDMNAESIQGIHMGFLLPWALLNSWAGFKYPGFLGETLDEAFRFYSDLRMKLVPYYYSLAYRSSQTGRAILRPLCLEYPEQEWTYEERNLFLIGDFLLTDVYSDDEVRLPEGRWYDFWSGKILSGDTASRRISVPENRGGHLFLREGALIPTQLPRQYIDAKAIRHIDWVVFPGEQESSFTLYLDDGDSLEHRSGRYGAVTLRHLPGKGFFWGEISGESPEYVASLTHTFHLPGGEKLNAEPLKTGIPFPCAATL